MMAKAGSYTCGRDGGDPLRKPSNVVVSRLERIFGIKVMGDNMVLF